MENVSIKLGKGFKSKLQAELDEVNNAINKVRSDVEIDLVGCLQKVDIVHDKLRV
jgi:hypothetical protein